MVGNEACDKSVWVGWGRGGVGSVSVLLSVSSGILVEDPIDFAIIPGTY